MSDPQGFLAENFPRIYLWLMDAKDSLHFLAIGMTATRDQFTMGDMTKIIASVAISAFASAYVTTERTAVKLEQYAAMQAEFRGEVRQYMREHEVKSEALRDRMTRVESIVYPSGMSGNGNNHSGVKK